MKKFISLTLAAVMVLSMTLFMASCGSNDDGLLYVIALWPASSDFTVESFSLKLFVCEIVQRFLKYFLCVF